VNNFLLFLLDLCLPIRSNPRIALVASVVRFLGVGFMAGHLHSGEHDETGNAAASPDSYTFAPSNLPLGSALPAFVSSFLL
jgi:hypothetical protein